MSYHSHFNFGDKVVHASMMSIQFNCIKNDFVLANRMREMLSQKFRRMLQVIRQDGLIVVNKAGGYFIVNDKKDCTILKTIKMTYQQVYEWAYSTNRKQIPLNTAQAGEYLLVQEKSGKIHYDNCAIGINSHAQLCEYKRLNEDNVMKYSYDPRDKSQCEYGIPGLRKSFVYDNNKDAEPFLASNYHLDKLEQAIKEIDDAKICSLH
jgi:hypothetical protein